ncbi:vWA domain-containing protein [Nocardioides daejeonensis]|uniref:vWA domain-containing protein n=1 Tax=Nocardioides daejeonensis TaxID=1046556 RepID=UPI000D7480ED|nr:VWA domain-containing protein [Nocardioides daejeonensis]
MPLLERHVDFVEALRRAGLPVSVAEDLDAARAISAVPWHDRETLRAAYAATLVKRATHRPTFDQLFDLWFPALVGEGRTGAGGQPWLGDDGAEAGASTDADQRGRDNGAALEEFRAQAVEAMTEGDIGLLAELAIEAVGRFGAMPGRAPGLSSWSAYQAMKRVDADQLVERLVQGLLARGESQAEARRRATRAVADFERRVEQDSLRRIAEEKGTRYVADNTGRPTIDTLDFMSARAADLVALRREIQPLARRLATRLTQQHHANRRGPLDFRRTVRASMSTGGVPLTTVQRPKRPHRSDLVVLCDVSGSVANFAQFTLLLVHALRDHFTKIRAFTFVDTIAEVTDELRPGADPVEVMAALAASARQAALWGRTNYGRAFSVFDAEYADALGPKTALLILGDARSNYADPKLEPFKAMVERSRHAWWLNPEHPRNWGAGDSIAPTYAEIVPMVECRNITQLGDFVHSIL